MNTTSSTRMNMRSMAPESPGIVKHSVISVLKYYLNTESLLFSYMCGFSVTRKQVILTNAIATLLLLAAIIIESHYLLAVASIVAAAYLISVLISRKEDKYA